jgi:putative sigma-54 modulation protein
MKLIIHGTQLDVTPALKTYIEEKMSKLGRFMKRWDNKGAAVLRIEVARTTKHHKKGLVYYAEANLDVPGAVIRAEAFDVDARIAINVMSKTLEFEIKKRKDKEETRARRGE